MGISVSNIRTQREQEKNTAFVFGIHAVRKGLTHRNHKLMVLLRFLAKTEPKIDPNLYFLVSEMDLQTRKLVVSFKS